MDIKFRCNETGDSLVAKAGRETKKYLKMLGSDDILYTGFLYNKPILAKAIEDYVGCVKKLRKIETEGLLEEFAQTTKRLIKAFDFVNTGIDRAMITDGYIYGKKTPVYLALEAAFNAGLFQEAGLQRRFKAVYKISRNIFEFKEGEYFLYAVPYIYYVNTYTGQILRCTKTITNFEGFDGDWYNVWYNQEYQTVYADSLFLGKWVDATYVKKSGGKNGTKYKYVSFSSKPYLQEYGGKAFKMPAHQVIMLCFYKLNILKFCLGSGSILTIDHISGDALNNSVMNLSLVTRVGNAKKGGSKKVKPVNFLELFFALQIANPPFLYYF